MQTYNVRNRIDAVEDKKRPRVVREVLSEGRDISCIRPIVIHDPSLREVYIVVN